MCVCVCVGDLLIRMNKNVFKKNLHRSSSNDVPSFCRDVQFCGLLGEPGPEEGLSVDRQLNGVLHLLELVVRTTFHNVLRNHLKIRIGKFG